MHVEAAGELRRGAAIDEDKPVGGQLQHVAVVADHHHGAGIIVQRLDQSLARIDVQMVGRLIEDQHVRGLAGDQSQCQPRPLAARHLLHLHGRLVAGEAEAAELGAHRGRRRLRH